MRLASNARIVIRKTLLEDASPSFFFFFYRLFYLSFSFSFFFVGRVSRALGLGQAKIIISDERIALHSRDVYPYSLYRRRYDYRFELSSSYVNSNQTFSSNPSSKIVDALNRKNKLSLRYRTFAKTIRIFLDFRYVNRSQLLQIHCTLFCLRVALFSRVVSSIFDSLVFFFTLIQKFAHNEAVNDCNLISVNCNFIREKPLP